MLNYYRVPSEDRITRAGVIMLVMITTVILKYVDYCHIFFDIRLLDKKNNSHADLQLYNMIKRPYSPMGILKSVVYYYTCFAGRNDLNLGGVFRMWKQMINFMLGGSVGIVDDKIFVLHQRFQRIKNYIPLQGIREWVNNDVFYLLETIGDLLIKIAEVTALWLQISPDLEKICIVYNSIMIDKIKGWKTYYICKVYKTIQSQVPEGGVLPFQELQCESHTKYVHKREKNTSWQRYISENAVCKIFSDSHSHQWTWRGKTEGFKRQEPVWARYRRVSIMSEYCRDGRSCRVRHPQLRPHECPQVVRTDKAEVFQNREFTSRECQTPLMEHFVALPEDIDRIKNVIETNSCIHPNWGVVAIVRHPNITRCNKLHSRSGIPWRKIVKWSYSN